MRALLLAILILLPLILLGRQETLPKDEWKKLKSEIDFKQKNSGKEGQSGTDDNSGDSKSEQEDTSWVFSSSGSTLNIGPVFQIVIIILFIGFLAALMYSILSNATGSSSQKIKKDDNSISNPGFENDFTRSNLEKWLQYAIDKNDLYLIIRIHFLLVLKHLELQKLIIWKKEKTNWHYIQELSGHDHQASFMRLAYEYDELWYGEKDYTENELNNKIDRFKEFRNDLLIK